VEDGYYHESVEFLQDSLETLSNSVAYGYEVINNFITHLTQKLKISIKNIEYLRLNSI
jgi:hypothetical protein